MKAEPLIRTTPVSSISVELGSDEAVRTVQIPIHAEEAPTILLAPNGFGKTLAFTTAARVFAMDWTHSGLLNPISPIRSLRVEFDEGEEYLEVSAVRSPGGPRVMDNGNRDVSPGSVHFTDSENHDLILDFVQLRDRGTDWRDDRGAAMAQYFAADMFAILMEGASDGIEKGLVALQEIVPSMLACGSAYDFNRLRASDSVEWLNPLLDRAPIHMIGTNRLGNHAVGAEQTSNGLVMGRDDTCAFSGMQRWLMRQEQNLCASHSGQLHAQSGDAPFDSRFAMWTSMMEKYLRLASPWSVRGDMPERLSSGQEQLSILFHGVLMGLPPAAVILIDEPELSLSVEWQVTIVADLVRAAAMRGSRLVVATHAPAIVNDWWDYVVEPGQ